MYIVEKYYAAIISAAKAVATPIVGSTQAEEVAQDVACDLLEFESDGRLKEETFLGLAKTIARNAALTYKTTEARRREIEAEHAEEIALAHTGEAAFDNANPLELLASEEVLDRLGQLSALLSRTLHAYYVTGWTTEEIADLEDVSVDVIYKRLERARNIIKNEGDTNE